MHEETPPGSTYFTAFRSAREEAGSGVVPEERWENEGGQMSATRGRIISTPDGELPYKVILSHHGSVDSERPFGSMRAAEAYIRRNTPKPPERRTLYDRAAPGE
jgi:hypothetical protein